MITLRALRPVLCAAVCLFSAGLRAEPAAARPAAEVNTPGPGRALGDSGFFAGGYAAASYRDLEGADPAVTLDSLSLFLWWENDSHWSFFTEIELQDAVILRPGDSTVDEAYPALERFHVDYAWSDALQLRVGKFLTPVGRWNVIHAAPLTWTTSRPLITEATFPTNATGAMVRGIVPVAGRALEWSVYASPGQELFPEPGLDTFSEAYGLHLNYDVTGTLQLGLSLVTFEQRFEQELHQELYGLDAFWTWNHIELMSEWAVRSKSGRDTRSDESGFYAQVAAPVRGHLYAVGRYESFNASGDSDGLHFYLGGLAWRVRPGIVLKLEYSTATENSVGAPEGMQSSIAVLF
jgi:hypothetical protein